MEKDGILFDNRKMKDVNSTTWKKLFEIPTRAKTIKGLVDAIMKVADCYKDREEVEELLRSGWSTVCKDGVIIWMDE